MDTKFPFVYVCVLNWNGYEDTRECLGSLKAVMYPNFKVLVIDNGSTDGSADRIARDFPGLEIIRNNSNLGFAGGNNEGIKHAHRDKPDLILLDLRLPAGGGLSILRNLKMSSETRDIPIVVITGVKREEIKDYAMREGAAGYIEKPYEPEVLLGTIKDILEKKTG